jgi:hypothetical protein
MCPDASNTYYYMVSWVVYKNYRFSTTFHIHICNYRRLFSFYWHSNIDLLHQSRYSLQTLVLWVDYAFSWYIYVLCIITDSVLNFASCVLFFSGNYSNGMILSPIYFTMNVIVCVNCMYISVYIICFIFTYDIGSLW